MTNKIKENLNNRSKPSIGYTVIFTGKRTEPKKNRTEIKIKTKNDGGRKNSKAGIWKEQTERSTVVNKRATNIVKKNFFSRITKQIC